MALKPDVLQVSAAPGYLRPFAIATAVVFGVSLLFPLAAGLAKTPALFPNWWGCADVALAFLLALLSLLLIARSERRVSRKSEAAAYRIYRVAIHGILGVLLLFLFTGDRIDWIHCATGFAWRLWLFLYGLPAWLAAMRRS